MKKHAIPHLLIFSIHLLVLLSFLSETIAQAVNIPDPALRKRIGVRIGKKIGETITQADLADENFTLFDAIGLNISDLTGLEYATNLETLYLVDNSISDLTPLSTLTDLKYLYLADNQISDISPISNISAINTLSLGNNNLTSLDGLPDLSAADALYFQFNQITNIKPLADRTEFAYDSSPGNQRSVDLEGNPLDDISINTHIKTLKNRGISVNYPAKFLKIISKDNLAVTNETKMLTLVVEVHDIDNNKLSGQRVRFMLVGPRGSHFENGSPTGAYDSLFSTTTDSNGRATANLIFGSAPGLYIILFHTSNASFKSLSFGVEGEPPPQEQEEPPPMQQTSQQELPVDESDTDTPQQQEEPPPIQQQEDPQSDQQEQQQVQPQQEQERQQQSEPDSQPEQQPEQGTQPEQQPVPNYTIIPFDYEKEGVGKVVFSELMFAQLNRYPQWIELYNTTDQDIEMKGWKIVGRYLDDKNAINILESHAFSKSFTIKGKETGLIVSFATPNSRDRITRGLVDKTYALGSNRKNLWNYEGLVLELQDAEGNPIDRIGNLNEDDEIVWEIPSVVREQRISLIRRLKSIRSQEYNFSFGITEFGWFPAKKVKGLIEKRNQYYYGKYTDIGSPGYRTEDGEPLPVTLASFNAQLSKSKNALIILSWITESELDNAGFNILRSQSKQGPFVRINPKLIQGAGTTGIRSSYTWTDITAKPNVEYYYQIEDVSFAGKRQTLTTTRLKGLISAKNRFATQWAQLKSSR